MWVPFRHDDSNPVLPPERRYVLVMLEAVDGGREGCAVGYLRYAAGDLASPYFVIPGIGGRANAWCDCLGDGFTFRGGVRRAGEHGRRYRVRLPVDGVPALKP